MKMDSSRAMFVCLSEILCIGVKKGLNFNPTMVIAISVDRVNIISTKNMLSSST